LRKAIATGDYPIADLLINSIGQISAVNLRITPGGVGTRPDTQGLQPETAAYVFVCTGTLTGWIGSRHQIKDAQETARNLITESITYYETHKLKREAAEARSEIAYCYWREGRVNEATFESESGLFAVEPCGWLRRDVG
jgi:hypothetical protein